MNDKDCYAVSDLNAMLTVTDVVAHTRMSGRVQGRCW